MARTMMPHAQALMALDFIREFDLSAEQLVQRYDVGHLNQMLDELGIVADGESEDTKANMLRKAMGMSQTKAPAAKKAAKENDAS